MLTSCKSLESRLDDLSGDEDILENTKPNLVSFSLSTSSSNQTVSTRTNSARRDAKVECCSDHVDQLKSFEHWRPSGEIKLPNFATPLTCPVADILVTQFVTSPLASIVSSCRDGSGAPKLFREKAFTKFSKTDVFEENPSVKKNSAISHSAIRHSSSMCSLYDVNSLHNDMPRFASHPQLNIHQESKRSTLTRSLSSITLKQHRHAYDHVKSKVKHYIKQLKRKKVEANKHPKESVVNIPHPKEDLVVSELQQEVERLQNYLEERDLLLQEVQSNYHSLLLQYGEAKNKLDQLRFTSVARLQAVKSVQTQSPINIYHETSTIGPYKNDKLIELEKIVHESENQISSPNKGALSMIENKERTKNNQLCQSTQLSDTDNCKLDFEAKEINALSVEKSSLYLPDLATLKVSSWFSSLPSQLLPVPSCYGSLGSSGSVSHQQQESFPTDTIDDNAEGKYTEPREQLWMQNCNSRDKPHRDCTTTAAEGGDMCFPPMEKCYCWAPNNVKNCILEEKPSAESLKAEMKAVSLEILCVPPLDLERLNDGRIPEDRSVSKNRSLGEDSLPSVCSQHSSFDENVSFRPTRITDQMYLETPTSYKSIVINPGRAVETKADENNRILVSIRTDQQSLGKNELYLKSTNIQSNLKEGNQKKVNAQRPCCLEKIMQRCCVNDIHICCHWAKSSNHQHLRCEQCVSRNSEIPSDSQMLLNLEHFLDNMSVCAEGLRKRSEAIQSFLTNLLDNRL